METNICKWPNAKYYLHCGSNCTPVVSLPILLTSHALLGSSSFAAKHYDDNTEVSDSLLEIWKVKNNDMHEITLNIVAQYIYAQQSIQKRIKEVLKDLQEFPFLL